MELRPHQEEAVNKLSNGKVLYGTVGSGKSVTALEYYRRHESHRDLVVITTAKKRDSLDWQGDAAKMGIGPTKDLTRYGTITVDSWNNIIDYVFHEDCFFIFDEQRLVGTGAWVKAFQKIAKKNKWILLSGTPGDTWLDYAPLFIANGWYKNMTEFKLLHVLYEPYVKYPKVRGYLGIKKLELMRNELLIEMPYAKHTKRFLNWTDVTYDQYLFGRIHKDRWNPYEERPIKDVAEMFRLLRRVVNSDPSRLEKTRELWHLHPRLIVFYNFNYELELLRTLGSDGPIAEYNGHKKHPVPDGKRWLYLVQYQAGAEGWNCISTNAMVLYSLTHSYKNHEQAQGRIDRLNTPFTDLFYYLMLTNSFVDRGIKLSLEDKKNFNARKFMRNYVDEGDFAYEGWGDMG